MVSPSTKYSIPSINRQSLIKMLTLGVDVDRLGVLLRSIFLHAEHFAVVVLVLQDVSVLLALEPGVLEIKQERPSSRSTLEHSLHLLSILEVPSIVERIRRA